MDPVEHSDPHEKSLNTACYGLFHRAVRRCAWLICLTSVAGLLGCQPLDGSVERASRSVEGEVSEGGGGSGGSGSGGAGGLCDDDAKKSCEEDLKNGGYDACYYCDECGFIQKEKFCGDGGGGGGGGQGGGGGEGGGGEGGGGGDGGGSEEGNCLFGSCSSLEAIRDAAKHAAEDSGQINDKTIGAVPIRVYAGDASQRSMVMDAIEAIFTATDQGGSMRSALEVRRASGAVKTLEIVVINSGRTFTNRIGGQIIAIDTEDVGSSYTSLNPGATYSWARILAHELGHAAMGAKDNGPGKMNNVNANENVVMRQLGDKNDRTEY
jgi:hypothetical protein